MATFSLASVSLLRNGRMGSSRGATMAALIGAFVAIGVFGCDRNIEPYQPGEEPRAPDLARIFPGPPAGSAGAMGGGAGSAAAGPSGADRAAFPPSRSEGAGSADRVDAAGGASISGRIELPPTLADRQPKPAVLFVIARPQGATGGPPLAVLRIPDPGFPLDFQIGPGDVMIPSMRFEGPITLTARLDSDGNAMTRGESDLASDEVAALEPGATGVTLVLGAGR
jgi:cytochrome c-type biogenesis protein CcmH